MNKLWYLPTIRIIFLISFEKIEIKMSKEFEIGYEKELYSSVNVMVQEF